MPPIKVLIAGTFQESEAYPNVKHRLRLIENSHCYDVIRVQKPLQIKIDYRSGWHRTLSLAKLAIRASLNSLSIIMAVTRQRSCDVIYLPYPATLLLWIISLLPGRQRPERIFVDLFISLYDTVVIDRQLFDRNGLIAKLIFAFEKRALNAASRLITDTPENSDYYASLFSISRSRFFDIPLSIDNQLFSPEADRPAQAPPALSATVAENAELVLSQKVDDRASAGLDQLKPFHILYIGTLVPLHNIGLVCRLARELKTTRPVEFMFVGDGQDATLLEQHFLARENWPANVTCNWDRRWQNASRLREYIHNADLCIGLLGCDGKSQRVWPIKNYLYMACGKPLLTARTPVAERLAQYVDSDSLPFISVNPGAFEELESAVNEALQSPESVQRLGDSAARFHKTFHADEPVTARLHAVLSSRI